MKPFILAVLCLCSTLSYAGTSGKPYPFHAQYELLQKQLSRYHAIAEDGGWGIIRLDRKNYRPGDRGPAIPALKKRLRASGDFHSKDTSALYTQELHDAVRKVQRRFGFQQNGLVFKEFVNQLNVPVEKRIQQLQLNMQRAREMAPNTGGTRLVANIPEFTLYVYEGDRIAFTMPIVVGTESNKTVVFNDEMQQIVFSPYWNVPPSIVRNEILPAMRKSRNYLSRNNMEQTGTENGLPVIRQRPGKSNSLGLVKFLFPNSHNIYFHDTPAKSLFQIRKRTFSHGCIRLAEPQKLATYLLRDHPDWTPDKIESAMKSGKEQYVKLPQKVPVSITYFTAWVDGDGLLNFREDIYGHDKEGAVAFK